VNISETEYGAVSELKNHAGDFPGNRFIIVNQNGTFGIHIQLTLFKYLFMKPDALGQFFQPREIKMDAELPSPLF